MTQQPFSRPGAIDLSALKRPAGPPPGAGAGAPAGGASGSAAGGGSYWMEVDQQNFQHALEASMSAPVLLAFYSPTRLPESEQMARDLAVVAEEHEGRFLAGLVNIDTSPEIAQAVQLPSVPFVFAVLDGRPAPLIQDVMGLDDLRAALNQVMQQLTAQGMTARHQPRAAVAPAEGDAPEPAEDPRYAPAQDALAANDFDGAVAEYQRLLNANPADSEAVAGLAMTTLLQRTQSVDPEAARAAAEADPDDIGAQTMMADLDLLGGRVEEAFGRLIDLVRRTSGDERNAVREHLVGLFTAVGNEDERVQAGRRSLASALF
ncbi:co-chaperone YbbN [Nocardioides sp.]|uniref:co-chaperone YbbN n=1 Tax=Nocardioides sp. TaxID=35761 RepID=UPI003563BC9D